MEILWLKNWLCETSNVLNFKINFYVAIVLFRPFCMTLTWHAKINKLGSSINSCFFEVDRIFLTISNSYHILWSDIYQFPQDDQYLYTVFRHFLVLLIWNDFLILYHNYMFYYNLTNFPIDLIHNQLNMVQFFLCLMGMAFLPTNNEQHIVFITIKLFFMLFWLFSFCQIYISKKNMQI